MPEHTIHNERPESQDRMIRLLQRLGYEYVSRADAEKLRGSKKRVLFKNELAEFLSKQKFTYGELERQFSVASIDKAIAALDIPIHNGLALTNKNIYDLICTGISLEQTLLDGSIRSFDMDYIDFKNPERNTFQVTDEFEMERANGKFARPDVILLVNGIPLVVIECKKSSVDVKQGIRQNIRNWQPDFIPELFKFAQIVVAANPNTTKYGTCGTPEKFFVSWKEDDQKWLQNQYEICGMGDKPNEQDRLLISLFNKERLLDIIKNFIIYDNNVKKVARYKQYFAVKKSMARLKLLDKKETRNGVIWHTQGSGKTITMVMLVKTIKLDKSISNPRFLLVSDRKNLDKQIRDNFINTNMQPVRATTGKGLVKLLEDDGNIVVTTIINKFEAAVKQDFVNESDNLFVLIDEGHRTQSGRFNTYMNLVLPNAPKIAFTGTPLLGGIKKFNTYQKFGPSIDTYTIEDAIEDGVTVPLVYEGRVVPQKVTSKKIDDYLKYILLPLNEEQKEDLKNKWSRFLPLAQTRQRLDIIAFDLYEHFIKYCKPKGYKAILTCSSRASAVEMYNKLKPLDGINPAVVITTYTSAEGENDDTTDKALKIVDTFFKTEVEPMWGYNLDAYEDYVRNTFVDEDREIDLLIVKDKLLTGFDAPIAGVLYVDKSMKDHTLLQAIARVNRVYKNKAFGLIVDYFGIFKKLNTAIDIYSDAQSGLDQFDKEDLTNAILGPQDEKDKLEIAHNSLWGLFSGINPNEKDTNIWQEHLRDDDNRKKFYDKLRNYQTRVDLIFSSYQLFKSIGKVQADKYRNDLIHFAKLRKSVSLRYNDSVDFSQYEDAIVGLLNTYVDAMDTKIIVEPLDILNKEKMDKQLERFESHNKAKAEAIRTRMTAELTTISHDDPALYLEFSERINNTLKHYMRDRDDDQYYTTMDNITDDFREGRRSDNYPYIIENDNDAKAFYAEINKILETDTDLVLDENLKYKLAELSLNIKETILDNAKRDWRQSSIVIKKMEGAIDDNIFDFTEANRLNVGVDVIDKLIEEIVLIAKKRF